MTPLPIVVVAGLLGAAALLAVVLAVVKVPLFAHFKIT